MRWNALSTAAPTGDKNTDRQDNVDLGDLTYPPKDDKKMKSMVQYILKYKKLPAVPEHLRVQSVDKEYPRHLVPEIMCQHCPGNLLRSDPVLITHKAKILTQSRMFEDVSTYCKSCHQCGIYYRYQQWKDGLHNFNDCLLIDLQLCLTTRNMLQLAEWWSI
ncbi:hypothetical protein UPYG_G00057320 [Umbra pygmaea]|uniref:HMG domain-containing protein n=1 Tax=Umbra pygmaea TaxID=75934 RepID=A0ABD0XBN1_UMBPY